MTASQVDLMVNKVADTIRPFALDVRRGMYDDGKMYLAVVNTVRIHKEEQTVEHAQVLLRLTGRMADCLYR